MITATVTACNERGDLQTSLPQSNAHVSIVSRSAASVQQGACLSVTQKHISYKVAQQSLQLLLVRASLRSTLYDGFNPQQPWATSHLLHLMSFACLSWHNGHLFLLQERPAGV